MTTNALNTAFYPDPSTPTARCVAQRLNGQQRQQLAVHVLAGSGPVTALAERHQVSRKFLYQQAAKGEQALQEAFSSPPSTEQKVLFYLPVTQAWLRQVVMALVLLCHSSFRGVVEFFRDVLDWPIALGSVHTIAQQAVAQAHRINAGEDLSAVHAGGHDEIFQGGQPVLVGVDLDSTYCYLLAAEDQRDGETWAIHLWDLSAQGLQPDYTVADGGKGLRTGQALAWPEVPCHGDVFHALQAMNRLSQRLDNRAYAAIRACAYLERKMIQAKRQHHGQTLSKALAHARRSQTLTIEVADQVRILDQWLQEDILALAGPPAATRQLLYDLVLDSRQHLECYDRRIQPLRQRLANQREALLAFATELDQAASALAQQYAVSVETVRELLYWQSQPTHTNAYWHQAARLHRQLGHRFFPLHQALGAATATLHRASSLVENLNSRLRNYFFLCRNIGPAYLELLRFFLNHRPFLRSHKPERRGKTPTQLLTGQDHPHWLEMLGFQRFRRAVV